MHNSVSANSRAVRQLFSSKLVRISFDGALRVVEAFDVIDSVFEKRAVELVTDEGIVLVVEHEVLCASTASGSFRILIRL